MKVFAFEVELVSSGHVEEDDYRERTVDDFPEEADFYAAFDRSVFGGSDWDISVNPSFTGEEFVNLRVDEGGRLEDFDDEGRDQMTSWGWFPEELSKTDDGRWRFVFSYVAGLKLLVTAESREQARLKCRKQAESLFLFQGYPIDDIRVRKSEPCDCRQPEGCSTGELGDKSCKKCYGIGTIPKSEPCDCRKIQELSTGEVGDETCKQCSGSGFVEWEGL
jgi:hypothetical protein